MTNKDYVLIADVIATCRSGAQGDDHLTIDWLAARLADRLLGTQPRFDRRRFLAACGHKDYAPNITS